ncbi:MAG: ParA family protein, partial [bacterium]|nr:ParA family protein [bacterium]
MSVSRETGRVVAVVNQKGGVGKSTTAVNLGACLAVLGKRVLVVDLDPQGNTSTGLGIDKRGVAKCIYDILLHRAAAGEVIYRTEIPGLEIIPATLNLAGAEIELVSALSRETRLKSALDALAPEYDYVLIDCPP